MTVKKKKKGKGLLFAVLILIVLLVLYFVIDLQQKKADQEAETEETEDSLRAHTTARLSRWCAELLVTAEWAGPQVVLRTPAGAAQLLAGAVDDAMMPGVMGCIAGDDTVLVITRGAQVAADVARHLLALADPSARA